MGTIDAVTSRASIQLAAGEPLSVCATEAVDIPTRCAERCDLLLELREQADGSYMDLSLPLSVAEVKAWIECALHSESGEGAEFAFEGDQQRRAHEDTLLLALKAADFLRDSKTVAAVESQLLVAIVGDYADGECNMKPPPSDAEIARAYQIVQAMPPHCLPGVLAKATRSAAATDKLDDGSWAAATPCSDIPDGRQIARLLQLLPQNLHPTILRECCQCPSGASAFRIPPMPSCRATCPQHGALRDSDEEYDDDYYDDPSDEEGRRCTKSCASTVFQLLAAAAPLAGGDVDQAWDSGSLDLLLSGAATADALSAGDSDIVEGATGDGSAHAAAERRQDYDEEPAEKRQRLHQQERGGSTSAGEARPMGGLRANTAMITQLALTVSHYPGSWYPLFVPCDSLGPEPARWCAALAQLRTLRHLSINAIDASHLSPTSLRPALLALPALDSLHINCEECYSYEHLIAPYAAQALLLDAVGKMTQLSALALINCFYLGAMEALRFDDFQPLAEVAQLSRLTRLTSLAARWGAAGGEGSVELMHAVKQMTALRTLDIGISNWMRIDDGSPLLLELVAATKLTALRSLAISSGVGAGRLHTALGLGNPALLSRLTSLQFPVRDENPESWRAPDAGAAHMKSVMALLADMPALQSLSLGCIVLGDTGLERLAALLPRMPDLTHLSIQRNDASHIGVSAILKAVARTSAQGLRELDISGSDLRFADAAELARLIPQLHRLEALNLEDTQLTESAWRGVIEALQALPHLRRLRVDSDLLVPGERPAAGLFAGLRHVCID